MIGGFKAPAKRVGFFWRRTEDATANGRRLFSAAVQWALKPVKLRAWAASAPRGSQHAHRDARTARQLNERAQAAGGARGRARMTYATTCSVFVAAALAAACFASKCFA
jgi:hypothetical protein